MLYFRNLLSSYPSPYPQFFDRSIPVLTPYHVLKKKSIPVTVPVPVFQTHSVFVYTPYPKFHFINTPYYLGTHTRVYIGKEYGSRSVLRSMGLTKNILDKLRRDILLDRVPNILNSQNLLNNQNLLER